jgi:hypothetical protein
MSTCSHLRGGMEPIHPVAGYAGLLRRDYLAAMAMQGILYSINTNRTFDTDDVAELAYELADSMLRRSVL